MTPIFRGSGVALVTPFRNGEIDTAAIKDLVRFQLDNGTKAIIACGTTGEPSTMTPDERAVVVSTICKAVDRKIPVVAGTGGNNTQAVIHAANRFQNLGCAAQLVVTPYYNKTNTEGLYRHFMTIAENTELPIIIYNVPSRTGIDIQPDMLKRLVKCEKIIGVKESSYDLPTIMEKADVIRDTHVSLYSGNDDMNYPLLALGADGVISVAANVVPDEVRYLVNAYHQGNIEEALQQQLKLMPLNRALFSEVNPIPCKAAMQIVKLCSGELRLPLYEISSEHRETLIEALEGIGRLRR